MKKKILILLLLLVSLSGCTKRFNVETDNKTTKSYVSNILCQPESEELLAIYNEYSEKTTVDISKLPKCSEFKINSGGYEGLWTSIFVKPISWLLIKIGKIVKSYGISIMLIGLLLRIAMLPITKKSTNMSKNMKKAQKDLDNIEKKYSNKDDKDAMMMKTQETMMIYKKYDINPFSSCIFALIQTPIFFAFLEAVYRVPAFFEETLWKFNLGMSPMEGFAIGNYWYILLIVLIGLATYYSFKNMNVSGNTDQQKQTKMMSTFMVVFITIVSFNLPAAIALYWIVSNGFTVIQNFLTNRKEAK